MKKSPRQAAVEALILVNEEGGYSNVVFNNIIKSSGLSGKDSAFAGVLFYGALERQLTLDHVLQKYSKQPIKKLSPAVREILRLSLYQLLYLNSVPESAAVNEGVKLARILRVSSAAGFVNGVLRSFLRDGKVIPPVQGGEPRQLSVAYSCPEWIIQKLLATYPKADVLSLLERSLGRPELYARVNTTKITADELLEQLWLQGISAQKDGDLENCLVFSSLSSIEALPAFQQGLLYIQDKSSQICAQMVGAQLGETVLDVCSAPGSKAFTIAQAMAGRGRLIACDIYDEKVKKIAQGAQRLGLTIIEPLKNDGGQYNQNLPKADRILCDVPCSGLGIISRKPEIKYKKPEELAGLPKVQLEILQTSAKYLKPGGRLVYSTCTVLPEENQQVVEQFLQENKNFAPETLPQHNGGWHTTLFPNQRKTDGFFIATIKRL